VWTTTIYDATLVWAPRRQNGRSVGRGAGESDHWPLHLQAVWVVLPSPGSSGVSRTQGVWRSDGFILVEFSPGTGGLPRWLRRQAAGL